MQRQADLEIDVLVEAPRWTDADIEPLARATIQAALSQLAVSARCALCVLACDDARISELNAEFRGKPEPTNVLSWPAQALTPPEVPAPDESGVSALGDIALAYETCAREADAQGKALEDHVTHLIVHGVLHLLGYDHELDEDADIMEALERKILGNLGISDPYR